MTKSRLVRDFVAPADPWAIVERWAAGEGYRCLGSGATRVYRKGAGLAVGSRFVQVGVEGGRIHLEAWVAANDLARAFSLGLLPREITVEPGGLNAVLPRRMGQLEIDGLLAAFGQPSVLEGSNAATPVWEVAQVPTAPRVAAMAGAGTPLPPAPIGLPPPPAVDLVFSSAAPPGTQARRGWRWPVRLIAGLVLLVALGIAVERGLSTPTIEERNVAASAGRMYATPKALIDSMTTDGVACGAFRGGDVMPGSLGTIIARSGDCTVGGQAVTATVFTRGPIMKDLLDGYVTTWLDSMRDLDASGVILVGPNWTVWSTDDQVLFDVQEAIGGTLHE